jgi:hypothetical protein
VNIKAFFVDALTSALDLGVARPEDVLKHVTPDVLAQHLPRPLWARLITACLGAPRVDAQLVIETIGIANVAEHVPSTIIWACLAEVGARAIGKDVDAPVSVARTASAPLAPPPPEVITSARPTPQPMPAVAPHIPAPASAALADLINELETSEPVTPPARARTPTAQRFRQSNTGIGRLGSAQRRPQAAMAPKSRRTGTEVSETELAQDIPVDDSQLVDWSSSENTQASDEDFSDLGRKR